VITSAGASSDTTAQLSFKTAVFEHAAFVSSPLDGEKASWIDETELLNVRFCQEKSKGSVDDININIVCEYVLSISIS